MQKSEILTVRAKNIWATDYFYFLRAKYYLQEIF